MYSPLFSDSIEANLLSTLAENCAAMLEAQIPDWLPILPLDAVSGDEVPGRFKGIRVDL